MGVRGRLEPGDQARRHQSLVPAPADQHKEAVYLPGPQDGGWFRHPLMWCVRASVGVHVCVCMCACVCAYACGREGACVNVCLPEGNNDNQASLVIFLQMITSILGLGSFTDLTFIC